MAKALPRNGQVAAQFELLADLLEIEGYDAFRVLAYRRAAALIRDTGGSIAQLALDGKAKQLQGIGKTIEGKIVEIVQDGEVHALTRHKQIVPADVVSFTRLPGLGPKTARRIWRDLGRTTLPDIRQAAERRRCCRARVCVSIFAWCRRSATGTCCSTSRARSSTTSLCVRTLYGTVSRCLSTASRPPRRAT